MSRRTENTAKAPTRGNLRIGDHWNAITIIALSQSNPLKAVAELVENSVDARAKTIVVTRGKDRDSITCGSRTTARACAGTPTAILTFTTWPPTSATR